MQRIRLPWEFLVERRRMSEGNARGYVKRTGLPRMIVYGSGKVTLFYKSGSGAVRQFSLAYGQWTGYQITKG